MRSVHRHCVLCGFNIYKVLYKSNLGDESSRLDSRDFCCTNDEWARHGRIVKCLVCGMVYENPVCEHLDIIEAYAQTQDARMIEEEKSRDKTFACILKRVAVYSRKGSLLDIGCCTGFFIKQAKACGWHVSGLELSRWAAEHAKKISGAEVTNSSIEATDFPEGGFDVITMLDVIEHLVNPAECLLKINKWLKKGGLICVSTHDINSPIAKLMRGKYPLLMQMHCSHFSKKTLKMMFDKCGFDVLRIEPHRRYVSAGYLAGKFKNYSRFLHRGCSGIVNILGLKDFLIRLNNIGLLNVYAVKR